MFIFKTKKNPLTKNFFCHALHSVFLSLTAMEKKTNYAEAWLFLCGVRRLVIAVPQILLSYRQKDLVALFECERVWKWISLLCTLQKKQMTSSEKSWGLLQQAHDKVKTRRRLVSCTGQQINALKYVKPGRSSTRLLSRGPLFWLSEGYWMCREAARRKKCVGMMQKSQQSLKILPKISNCVSHQRK